MSEKIKDELQPDAYLPDGRLNPKYLQPEATQLPTLPFAVFDEFGQPCDDRVRDHFAAAFEALGAQLSEKNIVRNDMHRIGQLQAQVTELERQPKPSEQDVVIARISAWYTPKSKADSIIDEAMQKGQS